MNKDTSNRGVLGFCLRLVEAVSRIVPDKWRGAWQQEWKSEIEYRSHKMQGWNRAGRKNEWRNQMKLFKRTLGAIADAAWLRQQFTFNLDIMQDIRFGLRQLRKNPGFTTVAVLTLALGIGATTAIFSIIDGVLLQPLRLPDPDRLVMVWEHNRPRDNRKNIASPASLIAWQERSQSFEGLAAFTGASANLSGEGDAEKLRARAVTPGYFTVLGVNPILGRSFVAEDHDEGADDVLLVSETFWRGRMGGAPDIIGRTLMLNEEPMRVVGVLPENHQFGAGLDVWAPLGLRERHRTHHGKFLVVVGRLKPAVSLSQAQAEMDAIAAQLEEENPDNKTGWGVNLVSLKEEMVGDTRGTLLLLLGAVGFLLLIACTNVANLLLARGVTREREIAVRRALGAGRWRLIRQLLTESLLLALLGGFGGLLLAHQSLGAILVTFPDELSSAFEIGLNPAALGFATFISLATGLVFGLLPALEGSRTTLQQGLREGGRSAGTGNFGRRLRGVLVSSEVALALVLLIGAGLLMQSLLRLTRVDPGFNPKNVLTLSVALTSGRYDNDAARVDFFHQTMADIEAIPGVDSVGSVSFLPVVTLGAASTFYLDDRPKPEAGQFPVANVRAVAGDYFQTMGIPLFNGRLFEPQDSADAPKAIVINQTMARQFWPDESPLGKKVHLSWGEFLEGRVVGVVGDVLYRSLTGEPRATLYWANEQFTYGRMYFVVRSSTDPTSISKTIRARIAERDPNLPVSSVRTMDDALLNTLSGEMVIARLSGIFSALALVLASVGIYGVVSYSVHQRTNEIGLRMALGASQRNILRMIVNQGLIMTIFGVALGLAGAFAVTRLLESFLFGVSPVDLPTFAGVSILLVAVSTTACWIPARRATKVDPMVALRYE